VAPGDLVCKTDGFLPVLSMYEGYGMPVSRTKLCVESAERNLEEMLSSYWPGQTRNNNLISQMAVNTHFVAAMLATVSAGPCSGGSGNVQLRRASG
jgi:hypothetical protein